MDEHYHRKNVENGRKFDYTYQTEGFQEVFLPRLKSLADEADKNCHPTSTKFDEKTVAYHIGYYNGLMAIMKEMDITAKQAKSSLAWLNDKKLTN